MEVQFLSTLRFQIINTPLGAVVASAGDLQFDFLSYSYGGTPSPRSSSTLSTCQRADFLFLVMSAVVQSCWLLMVKKNHMNENAAVSELLYYNSILNLPILFLFALAVGEFQKAMTHTELWDFSFQVCFHPSLLSTSPPLQPPTRGPVFPRSSRPP